MDEDRYLRYRDKILWIQGRTDLIQTWIGESDAKDLITDIKTMLAIFKAFQEITEAYMDCISMVLRDSRIPARDDYSNIDRIDLFTPDQKLLLREMNGLRNRIIHRYNGTDETRAISGITESLPTIRSLIQVIDEWIQNH